MPAFLATNAPWFTLYGDGTMVFRNPALEGPPAQGSVMPLNPMRTAKLSRGTGPEPPRLRPDRGRPGRCPRLVREHAGRRRARRPSSRSMPAASRRRSPSTRSGCRLPEAGQPGSADGPARLAFQKLAEKLTDDRCRRHRTRARSTSRPPTAACCSTRQGSWRRTSRTGRGRRSGRQGLRPVRRPERPAAPAPDHDPGRDRRASASRVPRVASRTPSCTARTGSSTRSRRGRCSPARRSSASRPCRVGARTGRTRRSRRRVAVLRRKPRSLVRPCSPFVRFIAQGDQAHETRPGITARNRSEPSIEGSIRSIDRWWRYSARHQAQIVQIDRWERYSERSGAPGRRAGGLGLLAALTRARLACARG